MGTAVVSNSRDASGFTWAQHLYTGLTTANLSAFFYWWGLGLNSANNEALIRYKNNAIETSKRLWALANYSRFVLPGAVRIGTTSDNRSLQITAFKNTNGSISIVVLNTSKSDIPVTFSLQKTGITQDYIAVPYITNTLNNTARQVPLPIHNNIFNATIQARSLVTYQVTTPGLAASPTVTPA
jgi:O-glycosyl hydrolase